MNESTVNAPSSVIPPGKRRKPVNIPDLVLRRAVLILIGGSLLATVLAPLAMLGSRSVYSTSGTLAIDPGKEPTLAGRERETIPGNIGDYTRTLLNRMTSGDVLVEAMNKVPREEWPSFLVASKTPEANIGRLFKSIKAKEVARTYLMSVEISGDHPRGLAPVLNAVLDAFVAKLRRELEQQNARRLAYLREERDQIVSRIADERDRMLALAAEIPNKAFLHESYNVHLSKLEQIQRLYWESEALRAQRAGDYLRAAANLDGLRRLSLQPYADERVADNFGINRIEQWTYEQLQQLRSTIDGLTTNNTDRTYVEMRMDAMNEYLRKYKLEVNDATIRILNEKREHDLMTELITSSNALAAAESASNHLLERLTLAQREATITSEAIFHAADMSFTVTQLRDRLTALNNRIDDVEMESKAPLRIYVDRLAGVPVRPSSNTRPQLALFGLVVAFGVVVAGVLGFEILDDRVRGPAEIAAALGGPAPGSLPLLPGGQFERVLLDDPASDAGVVLRALAVRLNRERLRHQARIFAFCPAGSGVGNTGMALNLSQAMGRLVPRVLMLSMSPAGPGACSGIQPPPAGARLLSDPSELDRCIVRDEARGIDIAGLAPGDDPLPVKTGLADLIMALRDRYDFVALDLGQVPADDLAAAALHFVDSVIFTAREDVSMYRELRQGIEAAATAGVPSMTAVLNGTRRPLVNRMHGHIQLFLHRVTVLHRRAGQEWRRRLKKALGDKPA